MSLKVAEGTDSTWTFHLTEDGRKALCGRGVFAPVDWAWRSWNPPHIPVSYCGKCSASADKLGVQNEVLK